MSELDDQTKQVADAYWGQTPSGARPPVKDAHGLGAPPRAMTEAMRRYWLTETSNLFGLWVACAVLFTIGHVIAVAVTGNWTLPPVLPGLFIAASSFSGKARADHRRRVARVLTEGELTGAVVRDLRQVENRRMVTTYVTYRVEGTDRDVTLASVEQGFAFLQVGLRDEVLFLRSEPDIVVPTFMIA